MDRFETDCIADSGGVVHIDIGAPGRRVHVVVNEPIDVPASVADWIDRWADDNANRAPIPLASLDRAVIYAGDDGHP